MRYAPRCILNALRFVAEAPPERTSALAHLPLAHTLRFKFTVLNWHAACAAIVLGTLARVSGDICRPVACLVRPILPLLEALIWRRLAFVIIH